MTAPGWYTDPHDAAWLQYFDGERWTGERQPAVEVPQPDPLEHTVPRTDPQYLLGSEAAHHPTVTYEPPAYEAPAPHPTPPAATEYSPPPATGQYTHEPRPAWTPTPRRAATTRRRRVPLIAGVCAAVVAGLLTGGWFALHKPTPPRFTFQGKKIDEPATALTQAQKALDVIVAKRHGSRSADTRCYYAQPANPPKGMKKSDVDGAVHCGPVLFVDGDAGRTYLSFPIVSKDAGHGAVALSAASQPISPDPAKPPAGYTLRRPDGRAAPSAATLTAPPPPPAPHNALLVARLDGGALPDAPKPATMVSLHGGIRLTKLGVIERYGTGDNARSAPPGQRLVALTYTSVPGQIANVVPSAGQLGISVPGAPNRPLPSTKKGQVVVVAVPVKAQATLTLNADGVRQSIAVPGGTPGSGNLAVLRRSHIDATLSINKPIKIRFTRPGTAPSTLSGTVTVRHALIGYWTDDGKHHAANGARALLWMDFLFRAPHQDGKTGIDAPLLEITPDGGRPVHAKDLDPSAKVFAVFDVPATFTRGTVTISGTEHGSPTIAIVTPVTFTVSIPK